MKRTSLFAFLAVIFGAYILASSAFAGATMLTFTPPADLTLGSNSTILELYHNNASDVTINSLTFVPSATVSVSGASVRFAVLSPSLPFNISASTRAQLTLFIDSISGQLPFGTYTTTLNATGTDGSTAISATVPVQYVQSFCRAGAKGGNLSIQNIDISSSGDEDEDWKLLDRIDVEVDVENNGENDIDDVQVELGLFDASGKNVVGDLDFSSSDEEQIDLGNLNDGDDDTVNFEFTVPADFDTGNYKLAIKVYSKDEGESNECDDTSGDLSAGFFQTISVDNEDDEEKYIVIDDIKMLSEATCGETVTGTFRVFNIGDEDQDQVLITMKNTKLGVNEEFEIREDLDKGDDDLLDFAFDIPSSARDGTYSIAFKTFYDYDDNDDTYDQESEDEFITTLKVLGCSNEPPVQRVDVSIDAELDSDAVAGQPLEVTLTLRNEGREEATVSLDVDGYDSWGDLDAISRRSFTLGAGDEQEVTLKFTVNSDVSGKESFIVLASINGQRESQEVEVDFGETKGTGGFSLPQGSGLLWIIGIINVVLILLIILVAVRLSRR